MSVLGSQVFGQASMESCVGCASEIAKNYSVKLVSHKVIFLEKSRIRETKHLSTDADSSTDTTVGWTKNTQKHKKI